MSMEIWHYQTGFVSVEYGDIQGNEQCKVFEVWFLMKDDLVVERYELKRVNSTTNPDAIQ